MSAVWSVVGISRGGATILRVWGTNLTASEATTMPLQFLLTKSTLTTSNGFGGSTLPFFWGSVKIGGNVYIK